jgi:hypothetical protein
MALKRDWLYISHDILINITRKVEDASKLCYAADAVMFIKFHFQVA